MLTYVTSARRQIQRSVRTVAFIVLCFSAFLLFQSCGTTLQFSVVETPSQVSKSKVTYESFDKSMTWEGVKISIPGKVARADLDNGSRAVLFDYSEKSKVKSKDMLLYDFAQDSVLWSAKTNATSFRTGNGATVIAGYGKRHVRSNVDGSFVRDGETGLFLYEGETLVLNKEMIASIDLLSGNILWQRDGLSSRSSGFWDIARGDYRTNAGYREEYRNGDWAFILYDKMYAFNVNTGDGYVFEMSTSHKGHLEAMAKTAAFACLAAAAGRYSTGSAQAKLYHNQNSQPLFEGDRVYIAARNKVYCFNRTTGATIWDAILERDYGGVSLKRAGDHLAIIGTGWKYVDYKIKKDQRPSILLVDANSGNQIGYFEFDEASVVNAFTWLEDEALLLTPTHLYRLSHDLEITGAREATGTDGLFLRFLRVNDQEAVIRTSTGLMAIDPETLDMSWQKALGGAPVIDPDLKLKGHWEEGARWVYDKSRERRRSHEQHGLHWLSTNTGLIKAVDLDNQGEVVMELDLSEYDVHFEAAGVIGKGDGHLIALPYNSLKRVGN